SQSQEQIDSNSTRSGVRNALVAGLSPVADLAPVEWRVVHGLVPYADALALMDERVAAIGDGRARELVWLIEHPALYTAGPSAGPTRVWAARTRSPPSASACGAG